jgi:hypothetical protein
VNAKRIDVLGFKSGWVWNFVAKLVERRKRAFDVGSSLASRFRAAISRSCLAARMNFLVVEIQNPTKLITETMRKHP